MIPYAFEYTRAGSVDEALALLANHDNARLLAGGHSLIPAMKLRLSSPSMLIDLSGIGELSHITATDAALHVGALATHRAVETSDVVQAACNVLAEVAGGIGDPQVRNKGTLGGSLAHADPAADYPALVLALNAAIKVAGRSGTRIIPAHDFFVDLFKTALADGEMITEVVFPVLRAGTGAAYAKFPNPASKYAVVGVAAWVEVDAHGICTGARIGVTGAAAHAFRASNVEFELSGKPLDEQTIADAVANMVDSADLLSDLSASDEYRAHLCSVMAKRALTTAAQRAMG